MLFGLFKVIKLSCGVFITILLLVTTLFSCKNESNSEKNSSSVQPELTKNFKVSLNVLVKQDDNFQIYYTEKTSSDFNEEESVWVEVKGSENPQDVVFNIPEDVLPTMFRLDFGVNDKQEDIKLNSINIEYLGKSFKSETPLLANYFRPLDSTQVDVKNGLIKAILKDGKRVEPAIYPHEEILKMELEKLFK